MQPAYDIVGDGHPSAVVFSNGVARLRRTDAVRKDGEREINIENYDTFLYMPVHIYIYILILLTVVPLHSLIIMSVNAAPAGDIGVMVVSVLFIVMSTTMCNISVRTVRVVWDALVGIETTAVTNSTTTTETTKQNPTTIAATAKMTIATTVYAIVVERQT